MSNKIRAEGIRILHHRDISDTCEIEDCDELSTVASIVLGHEKSEFIAICYLCDECADGQIEQIVDELKFVDVGGGSYRNIFTAKGPDTGSGRIN